MAAVPASCIENCGYNESYIDRVAFHELLRQIGEAYDAEIGYLKRCIQKLHESPSSSSNDMLAKESTRELLRPRETIADKPDTLPNVTTVSRASAEYGGLNSALSGRYALQPAASSIEHSFAPTPSSQADPEQEMGIKARLQNLGSLESITASITTSGNLPHERSEALGVLHRRSMDLGAFEHSTGRRSTSARSSRASNVKKLSVANGTQHKEHAEEFLHYSNFQKLTYVIDSMMSKRRSQGFALAITVVLAVFVFGLIWTIAFAEKNFPWYENLLEGFWIAWTFMADPGTHADVSKEGIAGVIKEQPERLIAGLIAAMGIVFMGATLGMIVDIIREKMDALRQGKSSVVERGHSLILGWTDKAVSIVEELCFANASLGGGTIVVLSSIPKDVIERDFEIQLPQKSRYGTRVVFRTGNPMVVTDLMKVGASTARATIILSNDGDADNSDAETLRVMLSMRTLPYKLEGHVVAEVRDIDNELLVKMVGGEHAETLVSHDVLGRLMLMAARQPGLAKVYEALLGFEGDEFYLSEWPELEGVTFGNLIERFPDAVPIGIFSGKNELILNPDPTRVIQKGEHILVIAEDDDTYRPEEPEDIDEGHIPEKHHEVQTPEKILFCGWRRDIRDIVVQLDSTLQPGSEIHMITGHIPVDRRNEVLMDDGLDVSALKRVKLIHHYGNPSVRRRLAALPLSQFTSCMIFADQAFESDTMQADSHSLATLLLLRDLQKRRMRGSEALGGPRGSTESKAAAEEAPKGHELSRSLTRIVETCPVVCEVLDPRTQKTIARNQYLRKSSEFCQTNKITAQIMAMIAENRSVNVLFDELLGVHGNSVNVYPADRYWIRGEQASFWTLAKRASSLKETLIGFKLKGEGDVVMNPPNKMQPDTWDDKDLVVISVNEDAQVVEAALRQSRKSLVLGAPQYQYAGGGKDFVSLFEQIGKQMDGNDCLRFIDAQRRILRQAQQHRLESHTPKGDVYV